MKYTGKYCECSGDEELISVHGGIKTEEDCFNECLDNDNCGSVFYK
jgi:hypothetical protein